MVVREVDEHHVAGGAFDEGADRGFLDSSDDEVSLPVAGNGTVINLGRAFTDHDHRVAEAGLAVLCVLAGFASSAASAECFVKLATQLTAPLTVEGEVDRLVDHVHFLPAWEVQTQHPRDLFRAPPALQSLSPSEHSAYSQAYWTSPSTTDASPATLRGG